MFESFWRNKKGRDREVSHFKWGDWVDVEGKVDGFIGFGYFISYGDDIHR